jgi:hypothetical protein
MKDLVVKTPEELTSLLDAIEPQGIPTIQQVNIQKKDGDSSETTE